MNKALNKKIWEERNKVEDLIYTIREGDYDSPNDFLENDVLRRLESVSDLLSEIIANIIREK